MFTLEQLKFEIQMSTLDELQYIMARYGGPKNVLMREKRYEIQASQRLTKMVAEEISYRAFEEIVLSDN